MNNRIKMNLLHSHPQLERKLGLDNNHVIVDKEDWEMLRHILWADEIDLERRN